MLNNEESDSLKEKIIEEIIKTLKSSAKENRISLAEKVEEFNNYHQYNLSIPLASNSIALNKDNLPISRRQERLGIVGNLFKSSDDYSAFLKVLHNEMTLLVSTEPKIETLLAAIDADVANERVFPFPPTAQDIIESLTVEQRNWVIKQIKGNSSFQAMLACAFLAADGDVLLLLGSKEKNDEKKALESLEYLLKAAAFKEIQGPCHSMLTIVRETSPYQSIKDKLEMMELSPTPEDFIGMTLENKRTHLQGFFSTPSPTHENNNNDENLKSSPSPQGNSS
jgi:hypothetical protein